MNDMLQDVSIDISANILKRAIWDYRGTNLVAGDKRKQSYLRESAKGWLTGEDCRLFCEFLKIDYFAMIKKLKIGG